MLDLASHVGLDLSDLDAARRRLEVHEAVYEASFGAVRRNELAQLMAIDIAELAAAFKLLAAAVKRGGDRYFQDKHWMTPDARSGTTNSRMGETVPRLASGP
jgi:hypothetical protein